MQFESLVEVCVGNKSTTHDVQSIILTHEHFITSEQLFRVLVGNFFEEEDIVQFRIVIFLKKWLDLVPSAFLESLPLKKCLNSFFEELETKRPEAMKVFQQAPNNEKSSPESPEETTAKTLRSCFPLIEHSPRAVASYLVLSDHALLCEIDTNELLKQRWLIPEQSPTLKACSDRIDRLCYWTTYKIINAPQKFRTKIADFYLKVCEHLLALQDFNALFGIFLGIMKLSDFGLNSFWKKSKNVDFYLKLKQICDFNNNFFTYRNLIKTLSFPLIEFQEIVLKDMLNITEGLPDEVNGALNVDKMLAMGKIIQRLNKSKATKFDNCSSSVGELDLLLSEIDNGMNWQQAVDKLREEHFKAEASKPIEKKDVPEQLKEQAKENRRTIKSMSIQKTKQGFRGISIFLFITP